MRSSCSILFSKISSRCLSLFTLSCKRLTQISEASAEQTSAKYQISLLTYITHLAGITLLSGARLSRSACPGKRFKGRPRRDPNRFCLKSLGWERHETNVSAGPSWMLKCCALVAARAAPGALSQLVAWGVWTPPNDRRGESHWRIMRTFFAIQPPPPTYAVKITQGRAWTGIALHLGRLDLLTWQASPSHPGHATGSPTRLRSLVPSSISAPSLSFAAG